MVLRQRDGLEILAFRHPLAGLQLVKGTIEAEESPRAAAIRELAEEAGIAAAEVTSDLGLWESAHQGQVWSFHLCVSGQELPDRWVHRTADDGGHDFGFFWHPLAGPAGTEWHDVFQRALTFIRTALNRHCGEAAGARHETLEQQAGD